MLDAAVDNTLVAGFNDLEAVEALFEGEAEQIAAVIVEPIAHNAASILPEPGLPRGAALALHAHGALLIFDEVITGFRHHLGGYQAIAAVTPDLTTMGKAIGNGFPVAALGGRRELMERFNTTAHGDVWFAGTYNGNVPGVAAALASIECSSTAAVHEHLFPLGERMRAGLREVAARAASRRRWPATARSSSSVHGRAR